MTEKIVTQIETRQVFDEFSPRQIILRLQSVVRYTLSRWWIILIVGACFGVAGAARAYLKKPLYMAELTFALDEGAAQSAKSDFAQISEQLGMGTVMDAGGVFSSPTNILELMQSRLLVEKALRSTKSVNGKPLILADFFLDSLGFRNRWTDSTNAQHRLNFTQSNADSATLFENQIMRSIYETIVSRFLKIDTKGKGTSIISVTCVTEHELFSKIFLEALIGEVTAYYISIRTERAKTNVDFLQKRTDSIKQAFSGSLYNRATIVDANINQVRQMGNVSVEKNQTEAQIQRNTYIDLVRSLEAARTTLMRETPLIQFIDLPILPLKSSGSSIIKNFLIFFLVFSFLTAAFLVARKGYRYIMTS